MATKECENCGETHGPICPCDVRMYLEELDDEIKRLFDRLNGGDVSWDTANELHADNCDALRKCYAKLSKVLRPLTEAEPGKDT